MANGPSSHCSLLHPIHSPPAIKPCCPWARGISAAEVSETQTQREPKATIDGTMKRKAPRGSPEINPSAAELFVLREVGT